MPNRFSTGQPSPSPHRVLRLNRVPLLLDWIPVLFQPAQYCSGAFTEVTPSPKCWRLSGHGGETVTTAIRDSCNVYFYNVGYKLACSKTGSYNSTTGTNILKRYAEDLGLATKAGIEIYEETPHASSVNSIASAIGQGNHQFSCLNLARYVTTIATSGTCYNLTLVDKITDHDGELIRDNSAEVDHVMNISSSTWDAVHTGMKMAGDSYSSLKVSGLSIAAKTGTAQERLTEEYKPEGDPAYTFSFTGTDGTTITAEYYEYDTNFYAAVVGDKVYLINKMNVRDLTDVYDTMINGDSEEETKSESDSTESDAEDTAEATATLEK